MRAMILLGLFAGAASALVLPASAEDGLVLSAVPTAKVESSSDRTERFSLAPAQAQEFAVVIVKRNGRYFWASRENRELLHSRSGVFDLFIEPGGSGYIKVLDQRALPDFLRVPGPAIQYLEQMTLGLATLTYWGEATDFSP